MSIKVELFLSPNCNICGQTSKALEKLTDEIGADKIQWRKVNVIEEIDLAVSLGILSTPSIVIDNVLVFSALPSIKTLREELLYRLDKKEVNDV